MINVNGKYLYNNNEKKKAAAPYQKNFQSGRAYMFPTYSVKAL